MKALVLSAGLGTRLGELTRSIPKPMLPIEGRPLLSYTLGWLRHHGIIEIAVNLHYLPEVITGAFGDGTSLGVRLTWSREEALLGTAGAVVRLGDFAAGEDLLVVYGDLLIDQDLQPLIDAHRAHDADATLLLHQRRRSNSLVALDEGGRIRGFIERPTEEERAANPFPYVNSGVQILSPRLQARLPPGPSDLARDVYAPLVEQLDLRGVALSGYRCAIDSPERYQMAREAVRGRLVRVW